MTLPFFGLPLGKNQFLVIPSAIGASYTSTHATSACSVTLTIKTDGTFAITVGAGDALTGTPTTGSWLNSGGTSSDYQVRFTTSNLVNSPTITNGASTFTTISSNLAITIATPGPALRAANVLVEIVEISGGRIASKTATMTVDGT